MISYQFQPGEHLDLMPTCPNCLSLYIVFRSRPLVLYVINNPSDVSDNHTNDEMSAMLGVWISKCMVWRIKNCQAFVNEWAFSFHLAGTLTCGAFTSLSRMKLHTAKMGCTLLPSFFAWLHQCRLTTLVMNVQIGHCLVTTCWLFSGRFDKQSVNIVKVENWDYKD